MGTSRSGQALIEFALIVPVLLALLLAVVELGMLSARHIAWQHKADVIAMQPAASADLSDCPEASLTTTPDVTLACTYSGIAVNGYRQRVTVHAIEPAPTPAPTATPAPACPAGQFLTPVRRQGISPVGYAALLALIPSYTGGITVPSSTSTTQLKSVTVTSTGAAADNRCEPTSVALTLTGT